jgi:ubiquinone/menaquinone biosynthesis C-methylase UbiE
MKLQDPTATLVSTHLEQFARCLPIEGGQRLVELGCGKAETTRQIAETYPGLEIIATEVDQFQHSINASLEDLPNVSFQYGGAEAIELPDQSVHYVVMLKSLHHVPVPLMRQSLDEIHRVLVPGGLAFLDEPVYAGDLNSILRLFNDEQKVRAEAFAAIQTAVLSGKFKLVEQVFFDSVVRFQGFADYESRILRATHLNIEISDALREEIKLTFEPFVGSDGIAAFRAPIRVDLLQRPDENE